MVNDIPCRMLIDLDAVDDASLCISLLAKNYDCTYATVSRHVNMLKACGLVNMQKMDRRQVLHITFKGHMVAEALGELQIQLRKA